MARYAYHQLDRNHKAIVSALEAVGMSVEPLGRPLDVLVGYGGRNWLIEIKQPKGKLRASQERFLAKWRGHAEVIRSVDEALAFATRAKASVYQ